MLLYAAGAWGRAALLARALHSLGTGAARLEGLQKALGLFTRKIVDGREGSSSQPRGCSGTGGGREQGPTT